MTVKVREISPEERDYWDQGVRALESANPLNAYGWGEVRSVDNWMPVYLVAERGPKAFCGAALLLVRKLPYLPYSVIYCPRGPLWDCGDGETIEKLVEEMKKTARRHRAIFLRCDPNIPEAAVGPGGGKLKSLGFLHLDHRWTFWNAPSDESVIDLSMAPTAEGLFNMLDSDTRRRIRKAARDGVSIEMAATEDDLRAFYDMFSEFTLAKGFMCRKYEYQKKLWDAYIRRDHGGLFLAKYDGQVIGGVVCIAFAGGCVSMHTGIDYRHQKLQGYSLVWESIRWAKERGLKWYSFRGVGTTHSQEHFKNKFLPRVVSFAGYYDLPVKRLLYRLFYFCEFTVLPKSWPYLMKARKTFADLKKALRIGR